MHHTKLTAPDDFWKSVGRHGGSIKLNRAIIIIATILIALGVATQAHARDTAILAQQQPAASLQWLTIDLWPDYDRASVLVLITGALPADAALPAQVTLPVPQNADLNAVARISEAGEMIDDIASENSSGALTFTTPDRRFRVEYYMPYTRNGLQRDFSFNWPGGPAVAQMDLSVQQPAAAAAFTVQPAAQTALVGNDGLQYHNLPMRTLQAAEPFAVTVSYTLSAEQLSAAAATPGGAPPAAVTPGSEGANWPLILAIGGALLLAAAVTWQLYSRRPAHSAPRKPRPARTKAVVRASFCHQCGAQAAPGDRFCRQCGTQLKHARQ